MRSGLPRRRSADPRPPSLSWVVLLAAAAACMGAARCGPPNDWCSPIAVRPDERFLDVAHCTPVWSDQQIAESIDVVLLGDFTDVAAPVIPAPSRTCNPSPSHATNASYVKRLRAARAAAGMPPLSIVHLTRYDLVPAVLGALPGFHAGYLLRTQTPWSAVTGFFTLDRTSACLPSGCRWSDSWGGLTGSDVGRRLRDIVDASGGAGTYASVVQYLARSTGNQVYWPTAAIADLEDPDYRAWRVAEAQRALAVGGYDTLELNQKFQQYRGPNHWIGGGYVTDVLDLNATGDTYWTAEPISYDYPEYVMGWVALALDLLRANVPYSVTLPNWLWTTEDLDDPSTPAVNEAELIREVASRARLVLVDRPSAMSPREWSALEEEIRVDGARVVPFDQACGLAGE